MLSELLRRFLPGGERPQSMFENYFLPDVRYKLRETWVKFQTRSRSRKSWYENSNTLQEPESWYENSNTLQEPEKLV